ncbi:MAG: class I SAM-dependent methyltransferase [Vicinamibacteria bacterium]|nr:class I SAM-dependent methyltransferase [Vicinamibacteria bacterium]
MKKAAAKPAERGIRPPDKSTASAFASSWNNVRPGSVYTEVQFLDWMSPLRPQDLKDASVIELGYGNGSLLVHSAACAPSRLVGVELGDTQQVARANLAGSRIEPELVRGDLCEVDAGRFDVAYCIGVLHHLKEPERGFAALLRHTRPGGRFHAWVYGREGNGLVIALVDPLRKIASKLPWWFTKYLIAAPAVLPYFLWARLSEDAAARWPGLRRSLSRLPLYDYTRWIAVREFWFFHHVAFDQLVTPQTRYFSEAEVRQFLMDPEIDPASIYVVPRNGNSWKFGGRKRSEVSA